MLSVLKRHNYDSIIEDLYDICVPIHNDLAFDHGIRFRAKFIGSLIIPRPTSRIEIVSAMRKVRKEFKLNCVEKRKVDIEITAAGITVSMVKRKRKSLFSWQENQVPTMFHPIYKVFYVSHDAQDLQIFSYIARDNCTEVFKCHVFKGRSKSEAMKIVRTVGQAFDLCQKSTGPTDVNTPETGEAGSINGSRRLPDALGSASTSAATTTDKIQSATDSNSSRLADALSSLDKKFQKSAMDADVMDLSSPLIDLPKGLDFRSPSLSTTSSIKKHSDIYQSTATSAAPWLLNKISESSAREESQPGTSASLKNFPEEKTNWSSVLPSALTYPPASLNIPSLSLNVAAAAANMAAAVGSVPAFSSPPPLVYPMLNPNQPQPFSPVSSEKLLPSHSPSTASVAAATVAHNNPFFQLMTSATTAATAAAWGSLTGSPTAGAASGPNLASSQTLPSNLSALSVQQYANPMSPQQRQQMLLMSQSFGGADLLMSPSDHATQQPMSSSWHEGFSPNQLNPLSLSQSLENQSVTSLRSQLDQAQKQAQVSIAHVYLLRDQLASETVARIESQTRTQQLMQANKELVDQVQTLVSRLQNLEARLSVDSAVVSPNTFISPASPKYSSPSRNVRSPSPRRAGTKSSSTAVHSQPESSRHLEVPPSASFYGESSGVADVIAAAANASPTRQRGLSRESPRIASPTPKRTTEFGAGSRASSLNNKQIMKMMKKQMSLDVQSVPHRNSRKMVDKKGRSVLGRSFELERIQLDEMQIESEDRSDSEYRAKEAKPQESKSRRRNSSLSKQKVTTSSKEESSRQQDVRTQQQLKKPHHRSSKKKSPSLGFIAETFSDSQSSSTDVIDLPLNPPYSVDRNVKNRRKLQSPAPAQSTEQFLRKKPLMREFSNEVSIRSNKLPQQNHVGGKQENELNESELSSSSEEQITITSPTKARTNCVGQKMATPSKLTNHKQNLKEEDSSEKEDFRIYEKQLRQQNILSHKILASSKQGKEKEYSEKRHNFVLSSPNR